MRHFVQTNLRESLREARLCSEVVATWFPSPRASLINLVRPLRALGSRRVNIGRDFRKIQRRTSGTEDFYYNKRVILSVQIHECASSSQTDVSHLLPPGLLDPLTAALLLSDHIHELCILHKLKKPDFKFNINPD